jgi:hypothetical protein
MKLGKHKGLILGGAVAVGAAGLLYVFRDHIRGMMAPMSVGGDKLDYDSFGKNMGDESRAYTAFYDIGPSSGWNGLNSEVWGFRDRKDRNDCLLDNRMPPFDLTAIPDYQYKNPPIAGSRDFDAREGGYSPLSWVQTTRTRCGYSSPRAWTP